MLYAYSLRCFATWRLCGKNSQPNGLVKTKRLSIPHHCPLSRCILREIIPTFPYHLTIYDLSTFESPSHTLSLYSVGIAWLRPPGKATAYWKDRLAFRHSLVEAQQPQGYSDQPAGV